MGVRDSEAQFKVPAASRVRTLLARILILWIILLIAASLLPISTRVKLMVGAESLDHPTQMITASNHRLAHWVAFVIISFLLTLLGRNLPQRFFGLAAVVALGFVIEELQHLIYSGPLETWDIRDDSYAALAGFIFAFICAHLAKHWTRFRNFAFTAL